MFLMPRYDFRSRRWFFVDHAGVIHAFYSLRVLRAAIAKEVS